MDLASKHIVDKFKLSGDLPLVIKGSRWHELPIIFNELGYTIGVEVGVELGRFARCLARKVPNLKLYGVDPWVTYDNQFTKRDPEEFYNTCVEWCKPFNIELIRKFSMDAVKDFEDESLDFVYIDGNHDFAHVTEDINAWSKKVKKGGIIAGHDYVFEPMMGAHAGYVVKDWTTIYKIKPWFIIDESTKKGGGRPTWFFVKQ
jgi:predicted O-methyltransferase YrrM